MDQLTNILIKDGYLRSDLIINAFANIRRMDFVREDLVSEAQVNIPLPIGYGQTISQPSTVAFMLELLDINEGHNILDVGSGSGWTTALMAHAVGDKGKVTAIDIIPELCKFGESNVDKYSFIKKGIAQFFCVSGNEGYPENAPYDRILVSASSDEMPETLKKQLKIGGKMVIPVGGSLVYVERKSEDEFSTENFPGFSFVPFVR